MCVEVFSPATMRRSLTVAVSAPVVLLLMLMCSSIWAKPVRQAPTPAVEEHGADNSQVSWLVFS